MAKSFDREVAYRVFANELLNTDIVLPRGDGKYAVQYVMTPTGAKVNRLIVVGAITDIEDIGTENEWWRVRISDPTGGFTAYAGEYQPDAARVLSQADIPEMLAIVGKIAVYTPEDGSTVLSIRPETVAVVDTDAMDRWVFQTAQQTLERIKTLESSSPESVDDMAQYRQMIRDALTGAT